MKVGRWGRTTFLGLAVLAAAYGLFAWQARPVERHPIFNDDRVLVIAHQGGDGLWPSNTMFAFENAVELGVDVLEMDIHSTQDGVLVTIHDETVDRTTDGSGRVQDFTFAELQQLDAGYHWPTLAEERATGRTDTPYRGQGITIAPLEEVFQSFPDMPMVIEIKQREPSIVTPFCELLRQYEMTDQVIVPTFHPETIAEFRQTCPEVATAAVEPEIRLFFALNLLRLNATYRPPALAFQVPEYSGDLHVVTPRFVRSAARLGIQTHPWTINDREQMRRMLDAGVQGIITDYPDQLMEEMGNGQ